jgi:SAM-dependent methyltransferase
MLKSLKQKLNNQTVRDNFVMQELARLPKGAKLLDAGAGSQRYRKYCGHLQYKAQDFGQYKSDEVPGFTDSMGAGGGYPYGPLDYTGDIWDVAEKDGFFDAILCTEVFEHIPYPVRTVAEFSRLLRPGGKLILTSPFASLRHMDPYYFYSGFSDRFYQKILSEHGLAIEKMEAVEDYYRWMAVEVARTAAGHSIFAKLLLAPAFLYFISKKATPRSVNTLCMGYHVLATKR